MAGSIPEAMKTIAQLVNLPRHPHQQDWEIECADPVRVEEFLSLYEKLTDESEKCVLMTLILASYDDRLCESGHDPTIEAKLSHIFQIDFPVHKGTVDYWRLSDEHDSENLFPITPYLRQIWQTYY